MKKKILISLLAVVVIVAGIAALSAYEAHVINVIARIENALSVTPEEIAFGTVFPQETLYKPLTIRMSDSFFTEDRVDDIEYVIAQKPKPRNPEDWEYCLESWKTASDNFMDCFGFCMYEGGGTEEECWHECKYILFKYADPARCYPPLCPWLSKMPDGTPEPPPGGNDGELRPFHEPGAVAYGRLAKSEGDIEDTWTIDLVVSCFQGMCAQDYSWEEFGPPLPPELEGETFGCDLWIEVTGISRSLLLENKNFATDWSVIDDDGKYGLLSYNASGPEFVYSFTAQGLTENVSYSLIYYADKDPRFESWGGDNPGAVIATFTTDGSGNIALTPGSIDLGIDLPESPDWNINPVPDYCDNHNGYDDYNTCAGAKIWLVPTNDLTGGVLPLAVWNPGTYLFETDLINYTDTDL